MHGDFEGRKFTITQGLHSIWSENVPVAKARIGLYYPQTIVLSMEIQLFFSVNDLEHSTADESPTRLGVLRGRQA